MGCKDPRVHQKVGELLQLSDLPRAVIITVSRPIAQQAYVLILSEGGFQLVEKVSHHLVRSACTE